jgi:hypothetical protein
LSGPFDNYQRAEALKRRNAGETLADIARSYGVHLSMTSRRRAADGATRCDIRHSGFKGARL